jgi:PAS domain-containing protein/anti-sigma regulatory factor (Ser/Thr protein kinase)
MESDPKQPNLEEKTLTSSIARLMDRRLFLKKIFFFGVLFLVIEILVGITFNYFFSSRLEQDRKQDYTKAWNNYLLQKWKSDIGKISAHTWRENLWENLDNSKLEYIQKSLENDPTLQEDYSFLAIYKSPKVEPELLFHGNTSDYTHIKDEFIINKLFQHQSGKSGSTHLIVQDSNDEYYMISISGLNDTNGKPVSSGIVVFALELERFLELAEEVIPVKLRIRSGQPSNGLYLFFKISDPLNLGDEIYIDVEPEFHVQSLVFNAILFFIIVQILISLALYFSIFPGYIRWRTEHLEQMIRASEALNINLEHKIEELAIAQKEIAESEAKYKHLVESSRDIIFSFSNDGFILTANKALIDLMGFKKDSLIGKYFFELAHNPEKKIDHFEKQLMIEKFEELKMNKTSVSFTMSFGTKNKEPILLEVRWEYVPLGDSFIVIGKAFTDNEDSMLQYFESEKKKYVIRNYITLAEQITNKITVNLKKYISDEEVFYLKICVREIIVNAIEHGNLDIDFDEKTKIKDQKGEYFKFLHERQNDPKYKDKKVKILYSLNPYKLSILIIDEGKGFDFKKYLNGTASDPTDQFLSHGRGIFMTKNSFDIVRYFDKGNRVLLVKKFVTTQSNII